MPTKQLLKVVVDRTRWVRGGKDRYGSAYLRNNDGFQCCLGFVGEVCGVPARNLLNAGMPEDSCPRSNQWPVGLLKFNEDSSEFCNTGICEQLQKANDRIHQSDEKKETRIIELGKKAGIQFEFVN